MKKPNFYWYIWSDDETQLIEANKYIADNFGGYTKLNPEHGDGYRMPSDAHIAYMKWETDNHHTITDKVIHPDYPNTTILK